MILSDRIDKRRSLQNIGRFRFVPWRGTFQQFLQCFKICLFIIKLLQHNLCYYVFLFQSELFQDKIIGAFMHKLRFVLTEYSFLRLFMLLHRLVFIVIDLTFKIVLSSVLRSYEPIREPY